jgi:hypothetical protein
LGLAWIAAGCGTPYSGALAVAGGAAYLGSRPSNDLEQTYYLGVFDPQEQVPPTVYRVTVRGQASALNSMRFASGWVPARAIDSLGSRIDLEVKSGDVNLHDAAGQEVAALKVGRRLMMFGPEGFREAPADHRLAIVMGSNADEFFGMVDKALGAIAGVEADQADQALHRELFQALSEVKDQRERIEALVTDVKVEFGVAKSGA